MPKTKIPAEYISDNPSLSGTDSVKVPAGTTAQRGTGVAGKFRFNTTLNKFEGYTDSWGEIGGSGGSALETDNFTGDDSTTAFTLSSSVSDEDNLIVFIDGVYQNKADYVASGTTLTLDTAPLAGRKIVVYHVRANVSGSNCILNSFSGNGSTTAFTLTQNPASENNTQVFIDGVYQRKSSYAVSGTTLTFDAAPGNGTAIEVMMFTQTDINTLPASFVSGLTEVTATGSDHLMVFDATDSSLKKALASDLIESVGSTPSFTSATISGSNPVLNIARTSNYTYKIGSLANDTFAIQSNETGDASYVSLIEIDSYAHQGSGPALKIDSSGNVGIGDTTSPTKQLEIRNNTATTGSGGAELRLTRGDSSGAEDDPIGIIDFYNTDADGAHVSSFIKAIAREQYARKGALTFGVASSTSTDATEVMRLNELAHVELNRGVGLYTDNLRAANLSITSSFSNALDFSYVGGLGAGRGFYLVTVVREGASVGTSIVLLVGLSTGSAVIIYDTISSNSLVAQTSGANLQIRSTGGSITCHATAVPIGITGLDS